MSRQKGDPILTAARLLFSTGSRAAGRPTKRRRSAGVAYRSRAFYAGCQIFSGFLPGPSGMNTAAAAGI